MTDMLEEFRAALSARLARSGRADPHDTAAVLAAAIDGVMLRRPLSPDLTSGIVASVLQRPLAIEDAADDSTRGGPGMRV